MKYLICMVAGALYFLSIGWAGVLWASIIAAILFPALYFLYKRILLVRKLKQYGTRIENIYVTSNHPGDRTVMQRVEQEKAWLIKAGNKLNVFVIPILYQDGQYCNETWEEYHERIKEEIAEDRIKRHTYLKQTSNEFYLKYVHDQKGVNYKGS